MSSRDIEVAKVFFIYFLAVLRVVGVFKTNLLLLQYFTEGKLA
jgi:hypothetical protein